MGATKQSAAFKREQKKRDDKKECNHAALVSLFNLKPFQKSEKDKTFSHYTGELSATCKTCHKQFVFTGMPRLNDEATVITLFMVPQK